VTRTRCVDTSDSPDDEHEVAQNMWRIEINIWKKNCALSWSFTRIVVCKLRNSQMCLIGTYSRVWVGKRLLDVFPTRNGFKQGDALSPLLFNFALRVCH
jgi:hypothetical protein